MASPIFARTDLAGPYRLTPARRSALATELQTAELAAVPVAPTAAATPQAWLAACGQALGLPTTFGANFDALFDALCDRELLPQNTLILQLGGLDALDEEDVDTLIAVLQAAADEWREQDRGLWALFDAPGLDLDPLPLGKT